MAKIVLYTVPSQGYFKAIINIVKNEVKTENLVYVTTNRPYEYVKSCFNAEKIETHNMLFLDCISGQTSSLKEGLEKCVFIESPGNISELSIALNQVMKLIQRETTILFDSLSTLLIYNDENVVGKFANFIITNMRLHNINSALIVLESDAGKEIIKVIESFVDEVKKCPYDFEIRKLITLK